MRRRLFGRRRLPSIKEGMDNLPFGIAFANPSGTVILCNHAMHTISNALSETELQNADFFWRQVEDQGERTIKGAYILRFSDGTIWLLMRRQCMLGGRSFYEITAQDVAERIHLIDRIGEENRQLASIGQRLKQYNKNALELARSRELLERKEHTHDELGKLLSATRHYLDGGDVDGDELWHCWHINAALMLEESHLSKEGKRRGQEAQDSGKEPEEDALLRCLRGTAESVGVRLEIAGDEPRSERVRELMLAAGGECVTNLLRHARGKELCIRVENRDGADVLYFTNDGEPPDKEVTEGGGLKSIRRKTEDMGGMMEVVSLPAYKVILTIPVSGGEENV